MARSCLLPPLSWKLRNPNRGPEQLLEAVVCLSQQREGLEWETAVSLSPSDEREATSPGLTPQGPQSRAHPPPRASLTPTPYPTRAPAPPSSASSPPHLPTQGSLPYWQLLPGGRCICWAPSQALPPGAPVTATLPPVPSRWVSETE